MLSYKHFNTTCWTCNWNVCDLKWRKMFIPGFQMCSWRSSRPCRRLGQFVHGDSQLLRKTQKSRALLALHTSSRKFVTWSPATRVSFLVEKYTACTYTGACIDNQRNSQLGMFFLLPSMKFHVCFISFTWWLACTNPHAHSTVIQLPEQEISLTLKQVVIITTRCHTGKLVLILT